MIQKRNGSSAKKAFKSPTSPPQKALALRYEPRYPAPFVVAKGKKELAQKLVQLARRHNITTVSEPELIDSLYAIDIGQLIPENLYHIVAEILVFARNL